MVSVEFFRTGHTLCCALVSLAGTKTLLGICYFQTQTHERVQEEATCDGVLYIPSFVPSAQHGAEEGREIGI